MRYKVGDILHTVKLSRSSDTPNRCFFDAYIPHDPSQERPSVEIVNLTVKEHHKVPWEYGDDNDKSYDGYILSDDAGNIWHNQYPTAIYGQISVESDYRFTSVVKIGEPVPDRPLANQSFTETKLMDSYLSELYSGIKEREAYQEGKPEFIALSEQKKKDFIACTENLKAHYDDIVAAFQKTYPNLMVAMRPYTFLDNDGVEHTLDNHYKVGKIIVSSLPGDTLRPCVRND